MENIVSISKDESKEHFVPSEWRDTFNKIIDEFRKGDFLLSKGIFGVLPISSEDAKGIEKAIHDYGENIVGLPDATWDTSVCQWMGDYWSVLIDIFTEEGRSDLVLSVRVREVGGNYIFEVYMVYVP